MRKVRETAGVALCALVFVACSDEPGGDGQTASPTSSSPPPASQPPMSEPATTTPQRETTASDGAPCAGFDGVAAEACQDAYDLCQVSGEQAIADEYAGGDVDAAAERYAEEAYAPAVQSAAQDGCLSGFAEGE